MKTCRTCNKSKQLNEFYKHPEMLDGYLSQCKECKKLYSAKRLNKLSENIDWLEKERRRGREKYVRLNYKERKPIKANKKKAILTYKLKFPEKQIAKNISQRIPRKNGNQLHHWNYNRDFANDVIELSISDHSLLHRYIIYDKVLHLYRDLSGNLLLTKESHIELLQKIKS